MGNQCCADGTQRKIYDANLKKIVDFDPTTASIKTIKFPIAVIPKKHRMIDQLNAQAGIFSAKNPQSLPSGTPSQPRLLNKQNLIYNGQWLNGVPHGKGQLYYPNGSYYLGYFTKGNADRQGRFISPEGWIYQGQLENQQAEGYGTLYHKTLKYKFEGKWSGDLPNGQGKQEWLSKNISYKGQFLNGKKHGQGEYYTPQFQYRGVFNNDQFDSFGQLQYRNGQKYEGNFDKGKKNGKGTYIWPDGSSYEGFYKDDLKHGQGKFKSIDNVIWQGQWLNGKREGFGTLYANNRRYVAQWMNGFAVNNSINNKSKISRGLNGASQISVDAFH